MRSELVVTKGGKINVDQADAGAEPDVVIHSHSRSFRDNSSHAFIVPAFGFGQKACGILPFEAQAQVFVYGRTLREAGDRNDQIFCSIVDGTRR